MNVTYDKGNVTVTMTADELGIIRYALKEGVDELRGTANYMKIMKLSTALSAMDTAIRAQDAQTKLEEAVQKWVRHE